MCLKGSGEFRVTVCSKGEGLGSIDFAQGPLEVGEPERTGLGLLFPPMRVQTDGQVAEASAGIHTTLVLRTRQRSSLSDSSKRWRVPFSYLNELFSQIPAAGQNARAEKFSIRKNALTRKPVANAPRATGIARGNARHDSICLHSRSSVVAGVCGPASLEF